MYVQTSIFLSNVQDTSKIVTVLNAEEKLYTCILYMCMCTYRYYTHKELHISSSSELGAQKSCLKSFLVTRIMKILPNHDSSDHNAQLTKPILIFFSIQFAEVTSTGFPKPFQNALWCACKGNTLFSWCHHCNHLKFKSN